MSKRTQNEVIKHSVRIHYSTILDNVDPEGYILDRLFGAGVITLQQSEEFYAISNERTVARKLVSFLFNSSHPKAFVVFREALRRDYLWIVEMMDSDDIINNTDNGIYTNICDQPDGVPKSSSHTSETTETQDAILKITTTTTTTIHKFGNKEISGQGLDLVVKQIMNQHYTQPLKKSEVPVKSTESADLSLPVQVTESCSNLDVIYPPDSGNFDEEDSYVVITEGHTPTRDLFPVNIQTKINFLYANHPEHPVKIKFDPSPDGNCQFDAVCNRLRCLTPPVIISPSDLRKKVVDNMRKNSRLSNWIERTDSASWSTYLDTMSQSGTHGDHLTLITVAKIYNVQIIVLSMAGIKYTRLLAPYKEQIDQNLPCIVLGYYPENKTHSGHYVSLEIENWSWEFIEKIVADGRNVACRESLVTDEKEISQMENVDNVDSHAALADIKLSEVDSTTILDFVESTNIFRIDKAEMEKYFDEPLNEIGSGGFGTVYSGSFQDIKVAIKSQTDKKQFLREKSLASLRNPYIVPVLIFSDDPQKLLLMFPLMAMDLADALNLNDSQKESKIKLSCEEKLRIIYHVSEGLKFLHTPKIFVRGSIIHGDVKPGNILLDGMKNACLADAGLAVVIPEKNTHRSTADMGASFGYEDPYKSSGDDKKKKIRRISNDLFSFGIVILQILKTQHSFVEIHKDDGSMSRKTLLEYIKKKFRKIPDAKAYCENSEFFDKLDWSEIDTNDIEEIADIALKCIGPVEDREATNFIAGKLKGILKFLQIPLFVCHDDNKNGKCINCFIGNAIDHSNIDKSCCQIPLFCRSCLNSPLNRPYCPLDGKYLFDSEYSCLFLISGQDNVDSKAQNCFKTDANKMYDVITKFAYTGMREENVHEFHLSENSDEQISKILKKLSEYEGTEPELLIFYYSGHADKKNKHLIFSEKCGDGITPELLRDHFKQIKSKRLLVILDCCNAGHFKVLPENCDNDPKWEIQMNSANPKGTSDIEPTDDDSISSINTTYKSTFTKCFIAALKGNRDCPMSYVDCKHCIKYRDLVSVNECKSINHIFDYISEHMKMDDPRFTPNMYSYVHSDTKIAH